LATTFPRSGGNRNRTILFVVIGLVAACLICSVAAVVITGGAAIGLGVSLLKPATDAGTSFMDAVQKSDYSAAYASVTPDQQTTYGGSAEAMQSYFKDKGWDAITKWKFTNINIQSNGGVLKGEMTLTAGGVANFEADLQSVGTGANPWRVSQFTVGPQ